MLEFNELRITPDGKNLVIDVSVKNEPYYDNIVIDSIVIDTQDTYVSSGPSSTPVYTYTNNSDSITKVYTNQDCNPVLDEDTSYCFVTDGYENRNIRLILNNQDLNLDLTKNIFFVYAIAAGVPAADTPCGMDNAVTVGTVLDLYPFYSRSIQYLKELENECEIPKGFLDMILRTKAIELSIKTGNYTQAISYWKKFLSSQDNPVTNLENCGCNK